jgi:hypothetical protein
MHANVDHVKAQLLFHFTQLPNQAQKLIVCYVLGGDAVGLYNKVSPLVFADLELGGDILHRQAMLEKRL